MKKSIVILSSITMLLMMCMICSCQFKTTTPEETKDEPKAEKTAAPVVGKLTAYYAKEDFNAGFFNYKKGQLICDSNDPINQIVEQDADNYLYEGDEGGGDYSWLLPKSKVEKRTYTMNQLSTENVGKKAVFVAENGCVARIFWSSINGHRYYNWNGEEEQWRETERLSECYVLSAEQISGWDGEKYLFEDQLEENLGNIKLYAENRYAGGITDPSYCRYREEPIGFVEERWSNEDSWDYTKTAFSDDGKLLVDQWEIADIPEYISIAYIGEQDALYLNGVLYFRK